MTHRAVIVGGGIGGLAVAIGLRRAGWDTAVLERSPQFGESGLGLSLWPNALRALDELGVGAEVRAVAVTSGQGGVREPRGRWLIRTDMDVVNERYGASIMMLRSDLHRILREQLPPDSLHAGVEVTDVDPVGLVSSTAGAWSGDLVVGADGIHSRVRSRVWPAGPMPRYSGYTAQRFASHHASDHTAETWGRGHRLGYWRLPDRRTYCFAVTNAPPGTRLDADHVRSRFGEWHDPIPALITELDPGTILQHDIYDLPALDSFTTGRVVLLGDAAHAMTPNLGQGACQALEDAVELSHLADQDGGLAHYDQLRRKRTKMIATRSRRIGALAGHASRPGVAVRNAAMRRTPPSLTVKSLGAVLDWDGGPPKTA